MRLRRTLQTLAGAALLGGLVAAAFFTRDSWSPTAGKKEDDRDHGPADEPQQVRLSAQAQGNLGLVVKPLAPETYWRSVEVPGALIDRPGYSDRGVVAPVIGVVTKVHHFPGDTVRPGETLFTLRLVSETLHLTQTELFKTSKDVEIAQEQKKRYLEVSSAVPGARIVEVNNQLRRLAAAMQAYRMELQTRGLTPKQIDGVAAGQFVKEIEVEAPRQGGPDGRPPVGLPVRHVAPAPDESDGAPTFEVQDLKVELGQQVQAGHTLCLLSNHRALYIEGRAFQEEAPLVERAAKEAWPVRVDFMEDATGGWPALEQVFLIHHVANAIDPASRTFAFFLPLRNQSEHGKDGRKLMLWRFRPGQRVRLGVRVEKLENVFVLPAAAVVYEGPEAYVFRQNGDLFERRPVRVVHQDRRHAVVANDGSVPPGLFVAHNAAAQINRAMKSGGSGLPPGFHMHADGSIHSNSAHK